MKKKIFLRSDAYDWLLYLGETDKTIQYLIETRTDATEILETRIKEANQQNNAALIWLSYGPRGLGKSLLNYTILYKILKSRGVKNWKDKIKFKLDTGEVIDTPSKFTEALKELGSEIETIEEAPKWALMQDEMSSEWGEGRIIMSSSQVDAVKQLRKLGLSVALADNFDDNEKMSKIVDFKIFVFGYDPDERTSWGFLKFLRWQGFIKIKIPKEVWDFLEMSYQQDAKNDVFQKLKRGFVTSVHQADNDDETKVSEVVSGESDITEKSIEDMEFEEYYYDIAAEYLMREGISTELDPARYWVLKNIARFRPRGKSRKLGYWTNSDIAKSLNKRESAVQKWLNRNEFHPNDVQLGNTLELALLSWLNQRISKILNSNDNDSDDVPQGTSSHNPSGAGVGDLIVKRSSGSGFCDLYVGECKGPDSVERSHYLSINAKVKTGDRSSYDIDVLPEFEHCPSNSYAVVWTPRYGLKIYKANVGSFSTSQKSQKDGLCEDISLSELENIIIESIESITTN